MTSLPTQDQDSKRDVVPGDPPKSNNTKASPVNKIDSVGARIVEHPDSPVTKIASSHPSRSPQNTSLHSKPRFSLSAAQLFTHNLTGFDDLKRVLLQMYFTSAIACIYFMTLLLVCVRGYVDTEEQIHEKAREYSQIKQGEHQEAAEAEEVDIGAVYANWGLVSLAISKSESTIFLNTGQRIAYIMVTVAWIVTLYMNFSYPLGVALGLLNPVIRKRKRSSEAKSGRTSGTMKTVKNQASSGTIAPGGTGTASRGVNKNSNNDSPEESEKKMKDAAGVSPVSDISTSAGPCTPPSPQKAPGEKENINSVKNNEELTPKDRPSSSSTQATSSYKKRNFDSLRSFTNANDVSDADWSLFIYRFALPFGTLLTLIIIFRLFRAFDTSGTTQKLQSQMSLENVMGMFCAFAVPFCSRKKILKSAQYGHWSRKWICYSFPVLMMSGAGLYAGFFPPMFIFLSGFFVCLIVIFNAVKDKPKMEKIRPSAGSGAASSTGGFLFSRSLFRRTSSKRGEAKVLPVEVGDTDKQGSSSPSNKAATSSSRVSFFKKCCIFCGCGEQKKDPPHAWNLPQALYANFVYASFDAVASFCVGLPGFKRGEVAYFLTWYLTGIYLQGVMNLAFLRATRNNNKSFVLIMLFRTQVYFATFAAHQVFELSMTSQEFWLSIASALILETYRDTYLPIHVKRYLFKEREDDIFAMGISVCCFWYCMWTIFGFSIRPTSCKCHASAFNSWHLKFMKHVFKSIFPRHRKYGGCFRDLGLEAILLFFGLDPCGKESAHF